MTPLLLLCTAIFIHLYTISDWSLKIACCRKRRTRLHVPKIAIRCLFASEEVSSYLNVFVLRCVYYVSPLFSLVFFWDTLSLKSKTANRCHQTDQNVFFILRFFWVSLLMSMVFVVCPGAQFGHFICHCINRVKSLTHQRMPIDFVSSKKCNRSIRDCFWMFFLDLNDNLNSWIAKTWQSKAKQRGEQKKID